MLTQKPYDLLPLIELIKKATPEQTWPAKMTFVKHLSNFARIGRLKFLPNPACINYASLKHAFELLDREWDNLYKASNDNYDKINLVWRQLIGFEMRRLPGIDRCVMAQGPYYVIEEKADVARTYTFADDSIDGLGGDVAVNVHCGDGIPPDYVRQLELHWETYVEQKTSNLQNLCSQTQLISRAGM